MGAGYEVVLFDSLRNSKPVVVKRIQEITGKAVTFVCGDVRNKGDIQRALQQSKSDVVIHFAGLKSVGESVTNPLEYYDTNVGGTLNLIGAMQEAGLRKLVFSSSATVYGAPAYLPIDENHAVSAFQPYGRSKLIVEEVLSDLSRSDPTWRIGVLRYFNPIGAHESGLIGEDPMGVPNNLMPFVAQVAVGARPFLNVWGGDYPTKDGTGIRDYIHVMDLAEGHMSAIARIDQFPGRFTVNLGTGNGYSVLEMVSAFERASLRPVPYRISERRSGDVAEVYADVRMSEQLLGWRAVRSLEDMCNDQWRWQSSNPLGYPDL